LGRADLRLLLVKRGAQARRHLHVIIIPRQMTTAGGGVENLSVPPRDPDARLLSSRCELCPLRPRSHRERVPAGTDLFADMLHSLALRTDFLPRFGLPRRGFVHRAFAVFQPFGVRLKHRALGVDTGPRITDFTTDRTRVGRATWHQWLRFFMGHRQVAFCVGDAPVRVPKPSARVHGDVVHRGRASTRFIGRDAFFLRTLGGGNCVAFLLSLDAATPFGFGLGFFLHFSLTFGERVLVSSDRYSP